MEISSSASAKRGRPRDPERMKRVLEAARDQFHANGFERTSMESVAHASGVSKVTIYNYFPSKEALFEAVIGQRTDEMIGTDDPDILDPRNPREVLTSIGREFLNLMRSDDVLGKHRTLYAIAGQHQQACLAFYRQGPEKLMAYVATYLRCATEVGSLNISNHEQAADQFLSLFLGGAHLRALLDLGKPSETDDESLLQANVALFVKGYGDLASG
jgi:TetR/AcrR family transcriptional repressor of mexJK operon